MCFLCWDRVSPHDRTYVYKLRNTLRKDCDVICQTTSADGQGRIATTSVNANLFPVRIQQLHGGKILLQDGDGEVRRWRKRGGREEEEEVACCWKCVQKKTWMSISLAEGSVIG